MPPPHPPIPTPLTLIVATTPISSSSSSSSSKLGIGQNGTLPWPRIKADMTFFARVTTRPPAPGTTNAIIMGRKTYESLPKHLRPLNRRINVVVTRDREGRVRGEVMRELETMKEKGKEKVKAVTAAVTTTSSAQENQTMDEVDAIVCSSLEDALETLQREYASKGKLGRVYVIGGGEIYQAALAIRDDDDHNRTRPVRIVMTIVKKKKEAEEEFQCDTFFPLDELDERNGWREASADEVTEWVGEEVSSEWRDEGEVTIRMVGFERMG